MSPLTLTDRRIYNLLIATAWDRMEKPVTHSIAKRELRGSRDANDRVGESVERLMAAIARLEIERDGKRYIRRVQLLGATRDSASFLVSTPENSIASRTSTSGQSSPPPLRSIASPTSAARSSRFSQAARW
jgi:hypothetical protein